MRLNDATHSNYFRFWYTQHIKPFQLCFLPFFGCANRTESASLIVGDNNLDDDVGRSDTKETNSELVISDVTNHRWRKCAALKESETDITTQEEFYKFDFQVNETQIPLQFNFDIPAVFFVPPNCSHISDC